MASARISPIVFTSAASINCPLDTLPDMVLSKSMTCSSLSKNSGPKNSSKPNLVSIPTSLASLRKNSLIAFLLGLSSVRYCDERIPISSARYSSSWMTGTSSYLATNFSITLDISEFGSTTFRTDSSILRAITNACGSVAAASKSNAWNTS